jgi:hypothetical protein
MEEMITNMLSFDKALKMTGMQEKRHRCVRVAKVIGCQPNAHPTDSRITGGNSLVGAAASFCRKCHPEKNIKNKKYRN